MRRVEFLQATANPLDAQIVGAKGRAAILREVAKGLAMPVDNIVPTDEQIDIQSSMQAAQQQQAAVMAQQTPNPGTETSAPGGAPSGGKGSNTVSNQITGAGA